MDLFPFVMAVLALSNISGRIRFACLALYWRNDNSGPPSDDPRFAWGA